jgi:hypothetical protein
LVYPLRGNAGVGMFSIDMNVLMDKNARKGICVATYKYNAGGKALYILINHKKTVLRIRKSR